MILQLSFGLSFFDQLSQYTFQFKYLAKTMQIDNIMKEVKKQATKIIRILTKVTQKVPDFSKDIDLALYAAIKIQKLVSKFNPGNFPPETSDFDGPGQYTKNESSDPIFEAAIANIQNFKESTIKLQSKINILINQTERQHPQHRGPTHHDGPEPPHYHHPYNPKSKKMSPVKIKRKKSPHHHPQPQPQPQDYNSRSLSSIDNSILHLSKQIEAVMNKQRSKRQSKNQSEVQQYEP